MSIQSLGVGSGLALDDLVRQLLEAERKPKEDRLNAREEKIESEISGLGKIKSKLSDFKDAVNELRNNRDLNGREPTITNPSEDVEVFTAEAANSALRGSYEIAISQLAKGSRIVTDDGAFTSSSDAVLTSGTGSLSFSVGGSNSFTVDITAGTTLAQLRERINNASDNFGVNANIIDTGTGAGPKLVFTSSITGAGNDLVINNVGGNTELDRLSTTGGTTNIDPANIQSATNALATIDGIAVQSSSNKFENTIQNVSFEAKVESPLAADGMTRLTSKLEIGFDREGLDKKVREFVDTYNGIMDEIKQLTRYGESELEEDGALAGDSLIRGIQTGLASIISDSVSGSQLGNIFQLGVEIDNDGKLEIGTTDFGLGSGEDRLQAALEDNFDEVAKLFTNETDGLAVRLFEFANQYTSFSGLLSQRERDAREDRDRVLDDRETLEFRMLNYEQILRDKYLNLDQTVAQLNSTGAALLAAL